jgi:glycosyltransferase involved in cell wall biosynthesis
LRRSDGRRNGVENAATRVSVIVPVWNGERFLAEALDSIVVPSLAQVEVIVVDDGSSDGSGFIAGERAPLVRSVRQDHGGLPRARNRGLAEARGSLIAFLDADDLWSTDKLAVQLKALERRPDVEIALGRTRRMWAATALDASPGQVTLGEPELALSFGAALVRRAVFDRVGSFDETFTYCDDWDWFMRAREMGVSIGVHSEVTLFYRRHDGNMTNDTGIGNHFFARMLRRSVERRRVAGAAPLPALTPLD